MLFQIYLTIFLVVVVCVAVVWALIRKPFLRRWNYESRMEAYARQREEEERVARAAAEKECDTLLGDTPSETAQQEVREQ
jgi:hypothetical protein